MPGPPPKPHVTAARYGVRKRGPRTAAGPINADRSRTIRRRSALLRIFNWGSRAAFLKSRDLRMPPLGRKRRGTVGWSEPVLSGGDRAAPAAHRIFPKEEKLPSRALQLDQARDHVLQLERRIVDQTLLLDRLRSDGHDTTAAEALMAIFLDLMTKLTLHRDALQREEEERRRTGAE